MHTAPLVALHSTPDQHPNPHSPHAVSSPSRHQQIPLEVIPPNAHDRPFLVAETPSVDSRCLTTALYVLHRLILVADFLDTGATNTTSGYHAENIVPSVPEYLAQHVGSIDADAVENAVDEFVHIGIGDWRGGPGEGFGLWIRCG
jgi:hypothetical protein